MMGDNRQQAEEQAFERALIQALAQAETEPPAFRIPFEIPLPATCVNSLDKLGEVMALYRSTLRLAFSFLQ